MRVPIPCLSYPKALSKVFALEIVISVGVETKVDEELRQCLGINVSAHTVLHTTCEVLVVDYNRYRGKQTNCKLLTYTCNRHTEREREMVPRIHVV